MIECDTFLGGKKLVPNDEVTYRPAAYGIIVKDSQVLLVSNRRTGKYSLPGGGGIVGEKLEDVLRREVREETGIEIQIDDFVFFRETLFFYDPLNLAFHNFSFVYRCQPLSLKLLADDEVDDHESIKPRWIQISALREKDFQIFGKEILEALQ